LIELDAALTKDTADHLVSGRSGMAKKTKNHTWRILVLRGNARFVGTVEATNQQAAIEKAKKELDIPPNQQGRLMAVRE